MTDETVTFAIIFLGLSAAVGVLAQRYGRSGVGWFLVSILLSPLVSVALVLALGKRTA